MGGCTRSSPGNFRTDACRADQPRCRWVAVAREQRGWPFMADRTPPADGSLLVFGTGSSGRYEHAPGIGVTRKCPRGWKSSAAGEGTQKRLHGWRGCRVDPHRAAAAKIAVTRFKISTSSRSLRFSSRISASTRRACAPHLTGSLWSAAVLLVGDGSSCRAVAVAWLTG
jgi:hypothetical protein